MTDEQLSALLRLKRHEQPPPGYFEELLRNVHCRQRAELIQRPLWRIGLERLQCFFGEHSLAPLSYAGALAVVAVVGVVTINSMQPQAAPMVARTETPLPVQTVGTPARMLTLEPRTGTLISQQPFDASFGRSRETPRYVIDARPLSYDAPFSF